MKAETLADVKVLVDSAREEFGPVKDLDNIPYGDRISRNNATLTTWLSLAWDSIEVLMKEIEALKGLREQDEVIERGG